MYLESYLDNFKRYALYEREINIYTTRDIINITKKLFEFIKASDLKEINTPMIRNFLYNRKEERLWSARTFRNQRQYLKTFFAFCVDNGFIELNPVSKVHTPKVPKTLPRFLTKEQARLILAQTKQYDWRYKIEKTRNIAIISMFLYTGMRLNELINLKTEDVNFSTREIHIKHGKGKKERIVPIYPKLMPILQDYLSHRERLNLFSPWFFQSLRLNARMSKKTVQGICRKIGKLTVYFSAHMLRHTFARNTINGGVNLFMVKELLGHNSINTTIGYLSVSKQALKETFDEAILL
ncbi:MAG: tyrosine-type recombinase/integrase [Flavobacteriaceae bacterium]